MSARSLSTRLAVLCTAALATSLFAAAPGQAAPAPSGSAPNYKQDPRSGAALNRDAALAARGRAQQGPTRQELPPVQAASLVNDPSADATAQDTQSETTLTIAGPNLVSAYNDSGSFLNGAAHFTGYSVSFNGGRSWQDMGTLPDSAEGDAGDPVLATDTQTGRVYMSTLGFNTGTQIQVFRSDDNGVTFGAPVNGTPGFGGTRAFQDKEWIAVDNFPGPGRGNVYLGWRQFGGPGEGVKMTKSTDGGATWGPNQGTTILSGDGQGSYVTVTPDHCVHFFFLSDILGGNIIKVRTSCDQGATFGPASTVVDITSTGVNGDLNLKGGLRSNAFPSVAVNPVNGTMYLTYNDKFGALGADIFLTSSSDGGATWSTPARVNSDGTANDQFFPTVAVNQTGRALMVGWYDRRDDPNNLAMRRYSRLATINPSTGVLTLSANFALSPAFPVVIGQDPVINTTYMGDYDQIAADRSHFFTTWGDNRLGNSFHANQPDVRFVRVGVDGTVGF